MRLSTQRVIFKHDHIRAVCVKTHVTLALQSSCHMDTKTRLKSKQRTLHVALDPKYDKRAFIASYIRA
jgi:hypothetical protein